MVGAIDYIKAFQKFCKAHDCTDCPTKQRCSVFGFNLRTTEIARLVKIVMDWKEKQNECTNRND